MSKFKQISFKQIFTKVNNLAKSSDEQILATFDKISSECKIDTVTYKNAYIKLSLLEFDINRKYGKTLRNSTFDLDKELEYALEKENIKYNEIFYLKLKNLVQKIFNTLLSIIPSKNYLRLFKTAFTLALCFISFPLPVFATTFIEKARAIEHGVKILGSVVIFMFLTCDLIQNGTKKDVAVCWQIVLKYLLILTALLSYRSVYNFIDSFFDEL